MIKTFCDKCGEEVKRKGRFIFKLGKEQVEIQICVNNSWTGGVLCLDCIKKIIEKGKLINTYRG